MCFKNNTCEKDFGVLVGVLIGRTSEKNRVILRHYMSHVRDDSHTTLYTVKTYLECCDQV